MMLVIAEVLTTIQWRQKLWWRQWQYKFIDISAWPKMQIMLNINKIKLKIKSSHYSYISIANFIMYSYLLSHQMIIILKMCLSKQCNRCVLRPNCLPFQYNAANWFIWKCDYILCTIQMSEYEVKKNTN